MGVERIAEALIQCGSIPGSLVRTLIETAPMKPKTLPTIEAEIALISRAEIAEPKLRGAADQLREQQEAAEMRLMAMTLRALQAHARRAA